MKKHEESIHHGPRIVTTSNALTMMLCTFRTELGIKFTGSYSRRMVGEHHIIEPLQLTYTPILCITETRNSSEKKLYRNIQNMYVITTHLIYEKSFLARQPTKLRHPRLFEEKSFARVRRLSHCTISNYSRHPSPIDKRCFFYVTYSTRTRTSG